jgi:hypothetical protein
MGDDPARQGGASLTRESNALHQEIVDILHRVRIQVNTGKLQPDLLQEAFNLQEASSRLDRVIVTAQGSAQYARLAGLDLTAEVSLVCDRALAALRVVHDQARILAIRHNL